ncbi:Sucrose nonfermenting 4-like protein [Camellia lanceoleosa]|uniref:Sucrose nonfermenting 4-like protein n=1 Tax=Camellia lanceoleosa TaxID=1840588 RepID=A0ACC0ICR1_9ERIC|nr:Sucrose nonfermenting 4-like protein [Camellia lanceoleosa]
MMMMKTALFKSTLLQAWLHRCCEDLKDLLHQSPYSLTGFANYVAHFDFDNDDDDDMGSVKEELETHTILAWKEGKSHLNRQINGSGRSYPRRLVHAGPYDSLKDVALKILQNKVATVPIIHSSSCDGSFHSYYIRFSRILKCKLFLVCCLRAYDLLLTCDLLFGILGHFRYSSGSLPILQQPIGSLPLGTWVPKIGESNGQPFAMLRPNASLSAALSLLVQGDLPLFLFKLKS